ncbi:unnamed protein product [Allacma fusca]|uniref:Uncharacterized protein n=1 Tax=Allacma fusca TaxID=39272 RepID=A0A8J2L752_9HEXA|nr:unnamed protein product [Allacma fusca]
MSTWSPLRHPTSSNSNHEPMNSLYQCSVFTASGLFLSLSVKLGLVSQNSLLEETPADRTCRRCELPLRLVTRADNNYDKRIY